MLQSVFQLQSRICCGCLLGKQEILRAHIRMAPTFPFLQQGDFFSIKDVCRETEKDRMMFP
jgi:hypothetical protein